MGRRRRAIAAALALLIAALAALLPASAQQPPAAPLPLPVLVPLTGSVALEGISQRNGALLAAKQIGDGMLKPEVFDTADNPGTAVTAWSRATGGAALPPAVIGPIVGAQMLVLLPLAQEHGVPLLTISGTTRLSEMGNPQFFRFFPSNDLVKMAQARYVVDKLGAKRPAVIYQGTAYGQSGHEQLVKAFVELKARPVLEESIAPTVNDLSPALLRAKAAGADALVLQLHAASTVLAIRQAHQLLPGTPIVAGSAMHQPATAALLQPTELKGVCAETAASPISITTSRSMLHFLADYRAAYGSDPDAFAAAQYDAVQMLGQVLRTLARDGRPATPAAVRDALATEEYRGVITNYRSDGKGNMAHEAEIVCFDGTSRVPVLATRYVFPVR